MNSVNVTIRLDEDIKKDFDVFCENVGINITTAFNMFVRATLRSRELPFPVTDVKYRADYGGLKSALRDAQAQTLQNGASDMTLDEINTIIAECRAEQKANA